MFLIVFIQQQPCFPRLIPYLVLPSPHQSQNISSPPLLMRVEILNGTRGGLVPIIYNGQKWVSESELSLPVTTGEQFDFRVGVDVKKHLAKPNISRKLPCPLLCKTGLDMMWHLHSKSMKRLGVRATVSLLVMAPFAAAASSPRSKSTIHSYSPRPDLYSPIPKNLVLKVL